MNPDKNKNKTNTFNNSLPIYDGNNNNNANSFITSSYPSPANTWVHPQGPSSMSADESSISSFSSLSSSYSSTISYLAHQQSSDSGNIFQDIQWTSQQSVVQQHYYGSDPTLWNTAQHTFPEQNPTTPMVHYQQAQPSTSSGIENTTMQDHEQGEDALTYFARHMNSSSIFHVEVEMEPNTKKVSRRRRAASSSEEKPPKPIRTQAQRDANNVRERNRVVLYQKVIKQLREAVNAPENTTIIETLMLAIQRITKLKAEFGRDQQKTVEQMTVTVPLATEFHTTPGLYNSPQLSHDCTNDSICKDSVLLFDV